mgnify:CR=1 FL=1
MSQIFLNPTPDEAFKELVKLRISMARVAQVLKVEGGPFEVKDLAYEELHHLAQTQPRGWNALAALCVEAAMAEKP